MRELKINIIDKEVVFDLDTQLKHVDTKYNFSAENHMNSCILLVLV